MRAAPSSSPVHVTQLGRGGAVLHVGEVASATRTRRWWHKPRKAVVCNELQEGHEPTVLLWERTRSKPPRLTCSARPTSPPCITGRVLPPWVSSDSHYAARRRDHHVRACLSGRCSGSTASCTPSSSSGETRCSPQSMMILYLKLCFGILEPQFNKVIALLDVVSGSYVDDSATSAFSTNE